MFTGLIEALGTIQNAEAMNGGKRITVGVEASSPILHGMALGDSIAVDGACMTAVAFDEQGFSFEASPESLLLTTLGQCEPGKRVNLERPLTPGSRIGGHYVTGHVDGLATVVSREVQGNSIVFRFEVASEELAELLIPKGSVAILGISLTVNQVAGRQFSVAIIPHTLTHTTLDDYHPGDLVNIETDLLGKYVRRLMSGYRQDTADTQGVNNAPNWDDLALKPAGEALLSTEAFNSPQSAGRSINGQKPAQIRTGGWFNF